MGRDGGSVTTTIEACEKRGGRQKDEILQKKNGECLKNSNDA